MIIQMRFEETRWYIIRGLKTETAFNGVCMQVPNDNIPSEIRPSRKLQHLRNIDTKVHELAKVCNIDLTEFDEKMETIREDQL